MTSTAVTCRQDLRHVRCLIAIQSEVVLVYGALEREEPAQVVALIVRVEPRQPLVPDATR